MRGDPSEEPWEVSRSRAVFALSFALLFCLASQLFLGDIELGLADEGYLWYGVQRTLAGEVPLRDFQAYEPGRYYWCAAFAPLVGDGLLGLRAATAAFEAVGLTFALLVAARFARSYAALALCGLVLGAWMFPRHKLFEPALASAAVWFALRLLERPTPARLLAAGLFAGFSGFFGRNHLLYAGAAFALLVLLLAWKEGTPSWGKNLRTLTLGALAGYAPMWGMLLFVPGFARAFWESNRIVLTHGTNLPLPWPWPWRTDWSALSGWGLAGQAALSCAFLLPCVVLPLGVLRALRAPSGTLRRHAPVVAAALVGLLYIHHASVRSHPHHLAESLPPALLAALALTASLRAPALRVALASALAAVTALAVFEVHPALSRQKPWDPAPLIEHEVAGERLRLTAREAGFLATLEPFLETTVPAEEPLFIAPNRPGLYPLLGRVSPSWWIFFFWPATEEEQRALVSELEARGVDWVFLVDRPIDRRDDWGFRRTHPLVWRTLEEQFERVRPNPLPEGHDLFRRRR